MNERRGSKKSDDFTYSNLAAGPVQLAISWPQNISKNISEVGPGIRSFRHCGHWNRGLALSTFLELRPTTLRIVVDFIVSS